MGGTKPLHVREENVPTPRLEGHYSQTDWKEEGAVLPLPVPSQPWKKEKVDVGWTCLCVTPDKIYNPNYPKPQWWGQDRKEGKGTWKKEGVAKRPII